RVLSHAAEAGAKVVLVGDPQQLQAIEAGAAFR
ncbi:AAA domain-containing protein, partial [Phyllobacterium leguminum]